MLLLVLLLRLPWSSNPDHIIRSLYWLEVQERIEDKVISTTLPYNLITSVSFLIYSIIYIGHSPPATSSLQSQDHKPLFSA